MVARTNMGPDMSRLTECPCGSGLYPEAVHDARGIFVAYACERCEKKKLAGYRPEIFTDSNYECDEPIEAED